MIQPKPLRTIPLVLLLLCWGAVLGLIGGAAERALGVTRDSAWSDIIPPAIFTAGFLLAILSINILTSRGRLRWLVKRDGTPTI